MSETQAPATATLNLGDQSIDLPVVVGTENEHAVDVTKLRGETGYITLDPGYRNTGSVESKITFINGEKGILKYRGIPIEQVAANSTFLETAWLVIFGELPTQAQLDHFTGEVGSHHSIHEGLRKAFVGFGSAGHPMAILSAMINGISCYNPDILEMEDESSFENAAARLMAKVATVAGASYKSSIGEPINYPDPSLNYCENFLHMMFSKPHAPVEIDPDVVKALDLILMLHADHEQNCSTATVRIVGSSGANLFASCAAGVCALWGPKHGGANVAVLNQLERIHHNPDLTAEKFVELAKQKKEVLYGFGHGVYKNFDPRAKILKESADVVLKKMGVNDPLLAIAKHLEEVALSDDYFVSRKLYPNVDFYSGIIMRAMGIPTNMFTVMFSLGRMPGWIANWKEVRDDNSRIYRPRQVYMGPATRDYVAIGQR